MKQWLSTTLPPPSRSTRTKFSTHEGWYEPKNYASYCVDQRSRSENLHLGPVHEEEPHAAQAEEMYVCM